MLQCWEDHCNHISDEDQWLECVYADCAGETESCFPQVVGEQTCEEIYNCMVDCGADNPCQQACYNSGTAQAQGELGDMLDCWDDHCGALEGDAWVDCIYAQCAAQLDTCFPPDNCDITGGDCAAGEACYPTGTGATDCVGSDEVTPPDACDPNVISCDDGYVCLDAGDGTGSCFDWCLSTADCGQYESCNFLFSSLPDFGICLCIDDDDDGHCIPDDCDDGDPAVYPGAAERCGNGIDDDCDGQTDEGCASCTDLDGDGYCDDVDCDDHNSSVNPGADEICGNGIDDDCDGQIDEDCTICTDLDGDGYCAETSDCDDHNSSINPAAEEVCGNGRDDDCDGLTDEGCQTSSCSGDSDCDDGNACTRDSCGAEGCVYEAQPDGMACAEGMMCSAGACVAAPQPGSSGCAVAAGQGAQGSSVWWLLVGLAIFSLRRRDR